MRRQGRSRAVDARAHRASRVPADRCCAAAVAEDDRALRKSDDVEFRQAAGVARNPPCAGRRCSAILRSSIAARIATSRCSIRRTKPRAFIVRACGGLFALQLREPIKISGEEPAGSARDVDAVHGARHAGRVARPDHRNSARSRVLARPAARRRREFPHASRRREEPADAARAGNRAAGGADPHGVRERDEKARAGEVVWRGVCGHAEPTRTR